mmetsp:Transcript_39720/g.118200  ORF Transcript_39720/g.118200 Transcript_39720/m.118200 type:complete len:292 (-) Transcript_39720:296-1171(-)
MQVSAVQEQGLMPCWGRDSSAHRPGKDQPFDTLYHLQLCPRRDGVDSPTRYFENGRLCSPCACSPCRIRMLDPQSWSDSTSRRPAPHLCLAIRPIRCRCRQTTPAWRRAVLRLLACLCAPCPHGREWTDLDAEAFRTLQSAPSSPGALGRATWPTSPSLAVLHYAEQRAPQERTRGLGMLCCLHSSSRWSATPEGRGPRVLLPSGQGTPARQMPRDTTVLELPLLPRPEDGKERPKARSARSRGSPSQDMHRARCRQRPGGSERRTARRRLPGRPWAASPKTGRQRPRRRC